MIASAIFERIKSLRKFCSFALSFYNFAFFGRDVT